MAEIEGLADQQTIDLDKDRLIINPGSVGQPRDLDSRAAYGIIDTDHRLLYRQTRGIRH